MLFSPWIGFNKIGEMDLVYVMQCSAIFTLSCMHHDHFSMPLLVKGFTLGTHFRCLREWENPIGDMVGNFHEVMIIRTTRWQ